MVKCSYVGCQLPAITMIVHPITNLLLEACDKHVDTIKGMIKAGRKKKYTIYEQKTLDSQY